MAVTDKEVGIPFWQIVCVLVDGWLEILGGALMVIPCVLEYTGEPLENVIFTK